MEPLYFVWMLPVLFMLHDLEEIIMVSAWKQRYATYLSNIRITPFGKNPSTAVFSCGVLEELLLLVSLSFYSIWSANFIIYYACLVGYTVHLFLHLCLTLHLKKYTPGILTVILQLPFCIYLLTFAPWSATFLLISSFVTSLLFLNVWLLHQAMGHFANWLRDYATKNDSQAKKDSYVR